MKYQREGLLVVFKFPCRFPVGLRIIYQFTASDILDKGDMVIFLGKVIMHVIHHGIGGSPTSNNLDPSNRKITVVSLFYLVRNSLLAGSYFLYLLIPRLVVVVGSWGSSPLFIKGMNPRCLCPKIGLPPVIIHFSGFSSINHALKG